MNNHSVDHSYAVKLAQETGYISCSLMQRRLNIGYTKAAILLDDLKREGIVSKTAEPYSCIYKLMPTIQVDDPKGTR